MLIKYFVKQKKMRKYQTLKIQQNNKNWYTPFNYNNSFNFR